MLGIERLHDRFAADRRRGRRGRPPGSAAGTSARRRGSRPGRGRRPRRSRRPASRAESRGPWRSSACRRARRCSPRGEPRQQRGDGAASPDRVAIDARDARAAETAPRTSASTRSVPKPDLLEVLAGAVRARLRHRRSSSCSSGSGRGAPRGAPSATRCSSGTRAWRRTAGRRPTVAKPRRFSSTIACSPRASRSPMRVAQRRG